MHSQVSVKKTNLIKILLLPRDLLQIKCQYSAPLPPTALSMVS